MTPPALAPIHPLDSDAYADWEIEEKTPVELETLARMIRATLKQELRPYRLIAVALGAALAAFLVALAFTLWGPG